jgi:hypothetical protein
VPTTRWFGFFNSSTDFDKMWHRRLLTMMYIMASLGLGCSAKPHELLKAKLEKMAPDVDQAKHRVGLDTQEAQTLRKSCKNTLELVLVVMMDTSTQLLARGVSFFLEPLHTAFNEQHKACRSVQDTLKWYEQMAAGDCITPLHKVASKLTDLAGLTDLGLATRWPPRGVSGQVDTDHPAIVEQDWIASLLGSLAMRLIGRNMVENSWHLFGFPGLFPALFDDSCHERILARMKKLWEIWQTDVVTKTSKFWQSVRKRCVFEDMYVLKVPGEQSESPELQVPHRMC